MGTCPDWYAILQVARYLGVPPWRLLQEAPIYWLDRAFIAMNAEAQDRKARQERM